MKKDILPRSSRSLCPACGVEIKALLYEESGDVWLRKSCPEHGETHRLFWKDADLYRCLKRSSDGRNLPSFPSSFEWKSYVHMATTLAMDPTLRCNLRCPDCFSSAHASRDEEESVEQILARVPRFPPRGFRPNMALVGGESTLRPDLGQLIQGLLAKNCTPRLNTNGLTLTDPQKRKRLKEAGLKWVILQFDGFSETASVKLRGENLIQDKLHVIEQLGEEGFSIHLAVMLARGINDQETARILEFSLQNRHVKRLSFYPRSQVGRNEDASNSLVVHLSDVLTSLESGTGGKVTRRDILEMKGLWHLLYLATRRPVFRQRICIAPFVLLRSRDGYVPLNRLFKPSAILKEPRLLKHLATSLGRVMAYDRAAYPDDILLVNIEKFYHTEAFDLDEAMNCHHIYVTPKGFIPFCLYNSFYRSQA